MKNLHVWMDAYKQNLYTAVKDHPDEFGYGLDRVEATAANMEIAFRKGTYNKSGRAIKATCKQFGIPYTYKAINAYLAGE